MREPHSDSRWHDNPGFIPSLCGKCKYWRGFGKCDKYNPEIPKSIMDKSFPGTSGYDDNYCQYRESTSQ